MDHNHELSMKIHDELVRANRILIVSHIRPDGDAIGSLLGIGLALKDIGKDVQMVLTDGVPNNFHFLEGSEQVNISSDGTFDYVIIVDSGDIERIDMLLKDYGKPDLNIDHHRTNTYFAKINIVDIDAVATSEILAKYLPIWGFTITKPIANALLAGIITDTIGFRTTNMHPDALRISAELMEDGGELIDIYYRTISEQSYAAARYWGAGLSKLQMEDGLVWTTLSLNERHKAGYHYRDDADLVKILSAIEGARVAVILTEQSGGYVKISWRLCGSLASDLDVADIARKFGGGGHKAAAGADVKGNLPEVLEAVLTYTRLVMDPEEKRIEKI